MHQVIEKNKININGNNKYIVVEIISENYNIGCNYKIRCTNCSNMTELGDTLYGKIIIIEKKDSNLNSVFKWTMFRDKNKNKIKKKYNIISQPYYINV